MLVVHHFLLAVLVMMDDMQCHAFMRFAARSSLAAPSLVRGDRDVDTSHPWRIRSSVFRPRQHRRSAPSPLFEIRGGSDTFNDEDEYDDSMDEFIASFESELAEIRREAELEAENEMQKLRGLIERRGAVEDEAVEEDEEGPESNEAIDEEDQTQVTLGIENCDDGDDVVQEEKPVPVSDKETAIEQSSEDEEQVTEQANVDEEALPADVESDSGGGAEEGTGATDDVEDMGWDDDDCGGGLADETDVAGDSISPDSETEMQDPAELALGVEPIIDSDDSPEIQTKQKVKPKASKKKKKGSKQGKKKVRTNRDLSDQVEFSGGIQEDVSLTISLDDDVQSRQSGVWFYLRSDLGRALCLFIATVAIAILTQRLQRQMEAAEM